MKPYLLPRLRDILFLAVFTAAILLGPRMLNQDGDLPRHLTIGRLVLQTGSVPTLDVFSYTNTGKPFAPHEWLAGLVFYGLYSILGLNGIVILAATLLATTFTLVYSNAVSQIGIRLPVFFLVAWGAVVSSLHWITRPHLFTMLFLALWLIWTEKLSRGENTRLWYFPALMLFWANMHGEFIAGFLVLFAYMAGWTWDFLFAREAASLEAGKRLGLAFVLSFAVTFINPVVLRTWTTVLGYVNNKYLIAHTNETVPPNFAEPKFLLLLGLLAFSIFLLAVKRRKMRVSAGFLLAGFSAMALLSARNVHLYGVVAPFVLAPTLAGSQDVPLVQRLETLFEQVESRLKGILWPVGTVLLFGILLVATPLGKVNRFDPAFFPVEAVAWLKQNPQKGNVFNAFDWGGYLLFNLWPDQHVFIDSQTDVYGEEFTRKYEQVILMNSGWQEVLTTYNVAWVIIPQDWPLAKGLAAEGWQEAYRDGTAIILIK
jgi:hypothetical protein